MSAIEARSEGEAFYRRVALHAGVRYLALDPGPASWEPVDLRAAALLTAASARALGALPVAEEAGRLLVAVADPHDTRVAETVRSLTGRDVELVVSPPDAIERAIDRVYGPRGRLLAAGPAEAEPPTRRRPTSGERREFRDLARHAGLEFVSLEPLRLPDGSELDPVNPVVAQTVAAEVCRRFTLLPVSLRGGEVTVAVADPFDTLGPRVVLAQTGKVPHLVVAPPAELERAIDRVFGELPGTVHEEEPEVPEWMRAPEPEPLTAPEARPVLGDLLVQAGVATRAQIEDALAVQRRTGSRLGQILVHQGIVGERELAQTLAEHLKLTEIDVTAFEPDAHVMALIPEPIARRYRFVPLAIRDHALHLAMVDPLDDEAVARIREHTNLPLRPVVTSRSAVEALQQRLYSERYVRVATTELLNRTPEESAFKVLSYGQKVSLVLGIVVTVVLFVWSPITTVLAFNVTSVLFYSSFSLYKFALIYRALRHDLELPVTAREVADLDERTLPTYTILVPLYREAAVVHKLVRSIARLDYPRERLDVKLIVEEDDDETLEALQALRLPAHFRIVVVPDAQPKTKPKACNYGLIQAEGKYVVIYDAEDQPEPDQLKKVVVAFSKAESRIACIQCKLNYYNRDQNILTRWFTSEYSNWFDLLMPGLDASDAPIPLGGTSNHFTRETLVELGAWDPFNVTEDADLGIRLHKAGYKTAIIDSTTFEEANSDLYNWIRQRSRWVKGYIQTWLVHMRSPVKLWRQLGWRSFLSFQMIIGGTFFSFLLNPVYWLLTTAWLLTNAGVIREIFPGFMYYAAAVGLYLGNFVFTYVNVAGSLRRGYHDLVKYALLSPIYWALMSVGAWKGFLQLLYRPFYWEKTVHGLDVQQPGALTTVGGRPRR